MAFEINGCIHSTAVFDSDDEKLRKHRFSLMRVWDEKLPHAVAIMYNPSQATHLKSDNSVKNCMNRVIEDGYGSIEIVNLFSRMQTNPKLLCSDDRKTSDENFKYIETAVSNKKTKIIILGWGYDGGLPRRDKRVVNLLRKHQDKLRCFGITDGGKPIHPRSVSSNTPLIDYQL